MVLVGTVFVDLTFWVCAFSRIGLLPMAIFLLMLFVHFVDALNLLIICFFE